MGSVNTLKHVVQPHDKLPSVWVERHKTVEQLGIPSKHPHKAVDFWYEQCASVVCSSTRGEHWELEHVVGFLWEHRAGGEVVPKAQGAGEGEIGHAWEDEMVEGHDECLNAGLECCALGGVVAMQTLHVCLRGVVVVVGMREGTREGM